MYCIQRQRHGSLQQLAPLDTRTFLCAVASYEDPSIHAHSYIHVIYAPSRIITRSFALIMYMHLLPRKYDYSASTCHRSRRMSVRDMLDLVSSGE